MLNEKTKWKPNQKYKINYWQENLNDIKNYKTKGSIIRSKENLTVNKELPTNFFYQQKKWKQTKT